MTAPDGPLPTRLVEVIGYLARRRWPSPGDSAQVWQQHHQRRADAYSHAAAHDPDHYHEATYCAQVEQATADSYAEHATQTQAGARTRR